MVVGAILSGRGRRLSNRSGLHIDGAGATRFSSTAGENRTVGAVDKTNLTVSAGDQNSEAGHLALGVGILLMNDMSRRLGSALLVGDLMSDENLSLARRSQHGHTADVVANGNLLIATNSRLGVPSQTGVLLGSARLLERALAAS